MTYYSEHKAERLEYGRRYYAGHREERKAYNRRYKAAHREELRAYNHDYYVTHKPKPAPAPETREETWIRQAKAAAKLAAAKHRKEKK